MKINNETKIGMLVFIVIVILACLTWQAGDFDFRSEGYEIKVRFKDVEGVTLNAPVTLSGFEVGRVKDIDIIYSGDSNVELTLWLDSSAKIFQGSKAYVKNMGFLGEKYIGLTIGDTKLKKLEAGSVIYGQESASLEKIISEGEVIAENIKEISQKVNERLDVNSEAIDSIFADMKVSMKNISSITENVDERLDVNKHLVDDFVAQMNMAGKNLNEMSYDLKENPWKLLYKPKDIDKKADK